MYKELLIVNEISILLAKIIRDPNPIAIFILAPGFTFRRSFFN